MSEIRDHSKRGPGLSVTRVFRPVALAIGRVVLAIGRIFGLGRSERKAERKAAKRGVAAAGSSTVASTTASGGPSARRPLFGWEPLRRFEPYRATLRRHRFAFALPPLVAMAIAFWVVAGAPKQYEAGTSLWFDNPPGQASSITDGTDLTGATTPPAAQAQSVLNELLVTRHFRTQIGKEGPLRAYLATHDPKGFGPGALLASLKGEGSLDDRVVDALGPKSIATKVIGPQILSVTLKGATPEVAAGSLKALISEFQAERSVAQHTQSSNTLALYQKAAAAAQTASDTAQAKIKTYVAAHPGAKPCGSTKAAATTTCDLNLETLTDSAKAAATRAADAANQLDQARISLSAAPASSAKIVVLDAPVLPTAPLGGMKKAALSVIAGLFAGLLVSLLAIIGITGAELHLQRSEEDRRRNAPIVDPVPAGRPAPAVAAAATPPSVALANGAGLIETEAFELEAFPERATADEPAAPRTVPVRTGNRPVDDLDALMADTGASFSGVVTDVRNIGTGRTRQPLWTVELAGSSGFGPPLGGLIHLVETPGHGGEVRALRDAGEGRLAFEVEITDPGRGSRARNAEVPIPPIDPRWVGTSVTFAVGLAPARRRASRTSPSAKGRTAEDRAGDAQGTIRSTP
jgi:hypothetical protein